MQNFNKYFYTLVLFVFIVITKHSISKIFLFIVFRLANGRGRKSQTYMKRIVAHAY